MRRQAKPFTVEIRKSRKSAGSSEPLLGILDLRPEPSESPASSAAAIATQKLFGRHMEAEALKSELSQRSDAKPVILAPLEARPRVLPDLSVEEKPAAEIRTETPSRRPSTIVEAEDEAEAVVAASPKRRAPRKRAAPIVIDPIVLEAAEEPILLAVPPAAIVADEAGKRPKRRPRIALRRRGDALLPVFRAGERWKRRLPPALW